MKLLVNLFVIIFCFCCFNCASSKSENFNSSESSNMADAPCSDCGERGNIDLEIVNEKFYREWNKVAFSRIDSSAVIGVFPAFIVNATRPTKCKFCHSFSESALDFDLARVEDSLMQRAFPKMQRELMLPGMRLPDSDTLYIDSISKLLLESVFADKKMLKDTEPWISREGIEQNISRIVPVKLKNLLNELASRYELRYMSIPISLSVNMDPSLGRSGGYTFKILWTMWDVRYGELVFLVYSEFIAKTTGSVAPEKEWAEPFASILWKMLSVNLQQLENH